MINPKDLSNIYQSLLATNLQSYDKATAIRLARATLLELISNNKKIDDLDIELNSDFDDEISKDANVFLDSIFEEMNVVNGSSKLFNSVDFDEDEFITDEELIDFNDKDKDEQEEIMDDMKFIFESIDADGDGMINQAEMNSLNGGLKEDKNAEAIKKLMVMMGMNIEDSVKESIQADIDNMLAIADVQ